MKNISKSIPLILLALITGCASALTPVTTRTVVVAFPPTVSQGDVIEDAIDVARELQFPGATKIDKTTGIVEFGDFGKPMLGITAQARVKSEGQLEVTIIRYSEIIPISVDGPTDQFKSKLEARLASVTGKVGK